MADNFYYIKPSTSTGGSYGPYGAPQIQYGTTTTQYPRLGLPAGISWPWQELAQAELAKMAPKTHTRAELIVQWLAKMAPKTHTRAELIVQWTTKMGRVAPCPVITCETGECGEFAAWAETMKGASAQEQQNRIEFYAVQLDQIDSTNPNQGGTMFPYEVLILKNPTQNEIENGGSPKIIFGPQVVIAKDSKSAAVLATTNADVAKMVTQNGSLASTLSVICRKFIGE